jgi:hypothetical protein
MVLAWRSRTFQDVCAPFTRLTYADNECRSESLLRRALFEETGGMYPELITRPDIKVFLPPIGGMTVYICTSSCASPRPRANTNDVHSVVGPPSYLSDESKELTLRVHDECRT